MNEHEPFDKLHEAVQKLIDIFQPTPPPMNDRIDEDVEAVIDAEAGKLYNKDKSRE